MNTNNTLQSMQKQNLFNSLLIEYEKINHRSIYKLVDHILLNNLIPLNAKIVILNTFNSERDKLIEIVIKLYEENYIDLDTYTTLLENIGKIEK